MIEINKAITEFGVEQKTALMLNESFNPFIEKAQEWTDIAMSLVVTSEDQTREMKMARQARLALKDIRLAADKKRKELKEDSLRYGKAVQGVYNIIEGFITPLEEHLEKQEKFAEILEAERMAKLQLEREAEIMPYAEFVAMNTNLSGMPEDEYIKLLQYGKTRMKERNDEIARIEREKIEAEEKRQQEIERMRLENERIKAEAAEEMRVAEEMRLKEAAIKAEEMRVLQEKAAEELRLLRIKMDFEAKEREAAVKLQQEKAAEEGRQKLINKIDKLYKDVAGNKPMTLELFRVAVMRIIDSMGKRGAGKSDESIRTK